MLGLASAVILRSESRGTHDHIYTLRFETLQPGGPGPCIYNLQEERGPVNLPGTGFSLCRLLRHAGLRWRYSIPPPHGIRLWFSLPSNWYGSRSTENTALLLLYTRVTTHCQLSSKQSRRGQRRKHLFFCQNACLLARCPAPCMARNT
jgi:hypothetical protein